MNILELQDIAFSTKEGPILSNVSFAVNDGEIIGVMGQSGTGKSSLFRMINLLRSPDSGRISYRGKNILEYNPLSVRREIAYISQKPYLFGKTVAEDLTYPYFLQKINPDFTEISNYLAKVNLGENVLHKKPEDLSGGEQQRVALIRSLLNKPRVLLLDEVTASLDEVNAALIEDLIALEKDLKNLTVLFITHNADQARRLAHKVLYLGEGRVKYYGPTGEFFELEGGRVNE